MSEAPPALSEDQISGALFVRYNALALIAALVLIAIGAAMGGSADSPTGYDPSGWLGSAHWAQHVGEVEVSRYEATAKVHTYTLTQRVGLTRGRLRLGTCRDLGDAHESVSLEVSARDARRLEGARVAPCGWESTGTQEVRRGLGGVRHAGGQLPEDVVLADQLALLVRTLASEAKLELQLLPGLSLSQPGPAPAVLRHAGVESVSVPAGTFSCDRFTLESGSERWQYWVARTPERPLVRYETPVASGVLLSRVWKTPGR
jgi:hypothetical protein